MKPSESVFQQYIKISKHCKRPLDCKHWYSRIRSCLPVEHPARWAAGQHRSIAAGQSKEKLQVNHTEPLARSQSRSKTQVALKPPVCAALGLTDMMHANRPVISVSSPSCMWRTTRFQTRRTARPKPRYSVSSTYMVDLSLRGLDTSARAKQGHFKRDSVVKCDGVVDELNQNGRAHYFHFRVLKHPQEEGSEMSSRVRACDPYIA